MAVSKQKKKKNVRPSSIANLKPFPKGVSGNPGGRPKYSEISKAIRHILSLPNQAEGFEPDTYAEKIALVHIKDAARRGSVFSATFVADRAEGKPTATVKQSVSVLQGADLIVDILNPQGENVNPPESQPPS